MSIIKGAVTAVIVGKLLSSSPEKEAISLFKKYKGITEDSADIHELLYNMWRHVGYGDSSAKKAIRTEVPWSAAFISYALKKYDDFPKSASHSNYIVKSRANAKAKTGNFRLRRINEYQPKVGDIVCRNRGGKNYTFDSIYSGAISHCDIVTKVSKNELVTVGGNVSNQIKETIVPIKNGYINKHGYFAVIENRHR